MGELAPGLESRLSLLCRPLGKQEDLNKDLQILMSGAPGAGHGGEGAVLGYHRILGPQWLSSLRHCERSSGRAHLWCRPLAQAGR